MPGEKKLNLAQESQNVKKKEGRADWDRVPGEAEAAANEIPFYVSSREQKGCKVMSRSRSGWERWRGQH